MYSKKYLQSTLKYATTKSRRGVSPFIMTKTAQMFGVNRPLNKAAGGPSQQGSSITSSSESFANGTSSVYMEQMYEQWRRDPDSVHASWKHYFQNVENDVATPFQAPPTLG